MKIFIVNLKKSLDRKQAMEVQLAKHEVDVEYIEAVNGKELSTEQLEESVFDFSCSHLSKGEIGCSLSHIHIYRAMVEQQLPYALVLEDDVSIPDDFLEKIQNILQASKLMDSVIPNVILLNKYGARCTKKNNIQVDMEQKLYQIYGSYGTDSYLINLAAAKNLALNLYPVKFEADKWNAFVNFGLTKLYKVVPAIFSIRPECGTTIDNDERRILFQTRNKDTKKLIKKLPIKMRLIYLWNKIKSNMDPFVFKL